MREEIRSLKIEFESTTDIRLAMNLNQRLRLD